MRTRRIIGRMGGGEPEQEQYRGNSQWKGEGKGQGKAKSKAKSKVKAK